LIQYRHRHLMILLFRGMGKNSHLQAKENKRMEINITDEGPVGAKLRFHDI